MLPEEREAALKADKRRELFLDGFRVRYGGESLECGGGVMAPLEDQAAAGIERVSMCGQPPLVPKKTLSLSDFDGRERTKSFSLFVYFSFAP